MSLNSLLHCQSSLSCDGAWAISLGCTLMNNAGSRIVVNGGGVVINKSLHRKGLTSWMFHKFLLLAWAQSNSWFILHACNLQAVMHSNCDLTKHGKEITSPRPPFWMVVFVCWRPFINNPFLQLDWYLQLPQFSSGVMLSSGNQTLLKMTDSVTEDRESLLQLPA